MTELRTERLLLRQWRSADLEPFAALNADPTVMRHFPAPRTREQSDGMADFVQAQLVERGWGLWAVERLDTGDFIGFTGLSVPSFEAPFSTANPNGPVEVGWRLAAASWGQGFAPEAARAACRNGFDQVGLIEIVSFTTVANLPSQRVMQKIGMTHDEQDDFDHPRISDGPLRRHVLYRLSAGELVG